MKSLAALFSAAAFALALSASAAFGACDPTGSGACCVDWWPNGQCLEEVDCSVCSPAPTPTPDTDPEPLPDEPFPYPGYPSCGSMGAC